MRITNNMIVRRQLDGLQQNLAGIDRAQAAVSSGKRLRSAADDPSAASAVMGSADALRAIQQYRTNVQRASDRLAMEDTVLDQLSDVLTRAGALGTAMASSTAGADGRRAAAEEAEQLLRAAVGMGNTRFGDEYLFGGDQSASQPFAVTGNGSSVAFTSTDPAGERPITVGGGRTINAVHDGTTVFLDTNALAALRDLTTALAGNDQTAIHAATAALRSAHTELQVVVAETGGRGSQLEMVAANLEAYEGSVTSLKSDLEDVNFEQAVTELMARQTAYQAAMMATSRVIGLTLTDYLR